MGKFNYIDDTVKGTINRINRRMDWLANPVDLHFDKRAANNQNVTSEFQLQTQDWVKGNLEIKTLIEDQSEPRLYVCRANGYIETLPEYHPVKDEVIDVLRGELTVELYDKESKELTNKAFLTKEACKFVVPANVGHYCYTRNPEGALYIVGYEEPNPNRNLSAITLDEEIRHLLQTTHSNSIYILETEIEGGLPIVKNCSDNIASLGIRRDELIGKSVTDFVDIEDAESLLSEIQTRRVVSKVATVKLPRGGIVTVVGFLYYLGGNKINEYLIKI